MYNSFLLFQERMIRQYAFTVESLLKTGKRLIQFGRNMQNIVLVVFVSYIEGTEFVLNSAGVVKGF